MLAEKKSIPGLLKSLKIPSLMSYHVENLTIFIKQLSCTLLSAVLKCIWKRSRIFSIDFISNVTYQSMYHPSFVLFIKLVHLKNNFCLACVGRSWNRETGLWF